MSSWVSSESAAQRSHAEELPLADAFRLLIRLRLTRWKNRRRQGFWSAVVATPANTPRQAASASGGAGIGILLWPVLLVTMFCHQSFNFFERLLREQGGAGLQGRAALFSTLNIGCLVMTALLGSQGWGRREEDDDVEWLSTLPAPGWVLHAAKLTEAALSNWVGWGLLFPFFTGLGLHAGLSLLAPLVSLGICLPVFFACALLGSWVDATRVAMSSSRALRVLRLVVPAVAVLVLGGWWGALALSGLKVDLLGGWLDFSRELPWLPFSEPARALLAWRHAPLAALGWLVLFGAEMAVLLGLGTLALRKVYRADLVGSGRVRRGSRLPLPASARARRRRSFGGLFGAVVSKELLWVRRNPTQSGRILLNVVLVNGVGLLLLPRASGVDPATLPGVVSFGAGALLLFSLSALLELERPALWHWASLPRSLSWVFLRKTLLLAALATLGALPLVLHTLRSLPRSAAALPALLYGATCVVVLAFVQTALWLRQLSPDTATSPLQHLVRTLKLVLFASFLGAVFPTVVRPAVLVPSLVIAAACALTFWHSTMERLPFVLDPNATRPATLSATFALVTLLVMGGVQGALMGVGAEGGVSQWQATAIAFLVAAVLVVPTSLLWPWLGGVANLRERLGVSPGKGLRAVVREGLLWSLPATGINLVYWPLAGQWLTQAVEQTTEQPPMMMLLADSSAAVIGVGCVAVPLVEELLFRGMLYRSLRSRYRVAGSLLLSALVFTAHHTLVAAVPVFCLAVCATLAFERSRSLYAAVLTHALYNGVIAGMMLGG